MNCLLSPDMYYPDLYFCFKDGDFLVRESQGSPGQYVLTSMNDGTPKHLLLIDPEGVVSTSKKRSWLARKLLFGACKALSDFLMEFRLKTK